MSGEKEAIIIENKDKENNKDDKVPLLDLSKLKKDKEIEVQQIIKTISANSSANNTPRKDYQSYQKLRESGSIPTSPREFFNCAFCNKNVSPRGGGVRIVKKIDLVLSYQKEVDANPNAKADQEMIPVETSCPECSLKVKSYCNSPRRFQRESQSPRNMDDKPPSPMLPFRSETSLFSRSPMRRLSERRFSNPIAIKKDVNENNVNTVKTIKFTPPRLIQSKSFT